MTTLTQFLRPEASQTIVAEIEQATLDTMDWFQRWHRVVLCGLPPSPDIVSPNAAMLTRFGTWYEANRGRELVGQPAFRALVELHRDMHDLGRDLALAAQQGSALEVAAYDAFVDKFNAFDAQARRITAAFRAALSNLDPLTGVFNRQAMLAELERERERSARSGACCAVALADLDGFKQVNDVHGHAVGDHVLLAVANRFLSAMRPYDAMFRYGGEEFLLCLPDTEPTQARRVLERLRQAVGQAPIEAQDGAVTLTLTASFGFAMMDAGCTVKDVTERADRALYHAKRSGRNRVVAWSDLQAAAASAAPSPSAERKTAP